MAITIIRASLTLIAAFNLVACGSSPVPEKTPPTPPAASANAPPSQTPRLIEGLGPHHHPIATKNAEAQRYFDQAMSLVFGFNHEEAVRSLARAAELDPNAAMPHWGIAWALGPNYNLDVDEERGKQANAAIATALELSKQGPDHERAYIEAMSIRFPSDAKPD